VDRYRGKVKTGGSDLDAEAEREEEEAALGSDLNDQTFRPRRVPLTALNRFISDLTNGARSNAIMVDASNHMSVIMLRHSAFRLHGSNLHSWPVPYLRLQAGCVN
jgi:hypothetical protein